MKKIKYYGFWIYPIMVALVLLIIEYFRISDPKLIKSLCIASMLGAAFLNVYIWSQNRLRIANGLEADKIGLLDAFDSKNDRFITTTGRNEAKYPAINPKLLRQAPNDFCFGRDPRSGRFVCRDGEGAILVVGASGSGKSTTEIITNLLDTPDKPKANKLVLDIKGELAELTVRKSDSNVVIFDPMDRVNGYGFDVFASLNEDSSDNEIYNCVNLITLSIIPSKGEEDFWVLGSRSLFRGLVLYLYQEKGINNLTEIIRAILGKPIKDRLNDAISELSPSSKGFAELIAYAGMPDETLFSLFENMKQRISVFVTDDDIAFALGSNPRKFSPEDLRTKSVYLKIPKHRLHEWSQLVLLIFNQTLNWCLKLPEKNIEPERPPIHLYLDETVALMEGAGKISELAQALRLVRSAGVMIVIAVQSISGMKCAMSDNEVNDVLSNIPYKVFLDCTTKEDIDLISAWCGTYRAKHESWNGSGKDAKKSISYEDEPIVKASDLMTLAKSDELILISSISGYSRIKKCPYYMDPYFSLYADKVKKQIVRLENK